MRVITITVDELRAEIAAAVREAIGERETPAEWLDQGEVAKLIGVARSSVPTMCVRDGLPHSRIGRLYRFERVAIERWLADRSARPGGHGGKRGRTLRAIRGG
jgi:excisionase family DNA binding protein